MDRDNDASRRPASPALPNARLNPLLNPLLAKQLGRWAHIYYTASVNNREAAIEKLVCELEAEAARLAEPGGAPPPASFSIASFPEPASETTLRNSGPVLVVPPAPPEAQAETAREAAPALEKWPGTFEPEVVEVSDDGRMSAEPPVVESFHAESFHAQEAAEWHTPAETRVLDSGWARDSSGLTASPGQPDWTLPQPVVAQAGSDQESREEDREMEQTPAAPPARQLWEPSPRDRYQTDEISGPELFSTISPSAPRWGKPLAAIALAAVVGAGLWIAYPRIVHYRSTSPSPIRQAQGTQPPAPETNVPAAVTPTPATQAPVIPGPVTPGPVTPAPVAAAPVAGEKAPSAGSLAPAATTAAAAQQASQASEEAASKDPDLLAGLRLLKGTGAERNSAEAVPHLWQAVKRQNAVALITLAELFAQGEGVSKDCDQAKILFGAAERQAKSPAQLQRIGAARVTLHASGCE